VARSASDWEGLPVRERLAAAFGGTEAGWRPVVGHHAGRRNKLVHGQAPRKIDEPHVAELRDIVQALLEIEFGISNPQRGERRRALAGP
jgi:hypothetical protein